MNFILNFIASGRAFFVGVLCVILAMVIRGLWKNRGVRAMRYLVGCGILLVGISAAPIPYWGYALLGVMTLLWLIAEKRAWSLLSGIRMIAGIIWVVAGISELRHYYAASFVIDANTPVHVIGDSVSAGIGGGVATWPELLRQSGWNISNHAVAAASTSEAMLQLRQIPNDGGMIIIEIGGNDLLGATPAEKFRADLETLLQGISAAKHTAVMFELPLPPLHNSYGMAQRELAKKYNVPLIPKRLFMDILSASQGTSDSIHLTNSGHQEMAAVVSRIIVRKK